MGKPDYFNEWEYFVWRHRGKGNLFLHFLSFSIFFLGLFLFFQNFYWPWLLTIPLSQIIGFSGHYFFEEGGVRSRDFVSPMTLVYLLKVFILIALGKYSKTLVAIKKKRELNSPEENVEKLFQGH